MLINGCGDGGCDFCQLVEVIFNCTREPGTYCCSRLGSSRFISETWLSAVHIEVVC